MFSIGRCSAYVYGLDMQMVSICVCLTYADALHMDMFSLYGCLSFPRRSESDSPGSSENAPARGGAKTPHTGIPYHPATPYIVFLPCPVTRRPDLTRGDMIISCAWYTSGKSHIA